jgi:hypothetical protein
MSKYIPTALSMVSAPKRVKKEKEVKLEEDKVYNLRPDWMKPEFIKKQEDNKDANLESLKRNEEDHYDYDDYDDYESNHYYNDEDLYYKELYYERLNNILSKYEPEDYESRYYAKIYFELQQIDEEIHPWNYY